jgi:ubiquinone/menaquinone biosynthesis C-methylase UbiE
MSTPLDPRREYGGTYFVQDRSNEEELTRVAIQDQMTTAGMGGVLPEQPDPMRFRRVLDVGCGTSDWLMEVARTYPDISHLVGIDVSQKMIEYARTQAQAQQVSDRVEFRLMDALQMLEFPADSFDLVNQRFGVSYLRTWDWPKLLHEYLRVTRPGGVIRITEATFITESSSPALNRTFELTRNTLYQAGHLFTSDNNGVTSELGRLLKQFGVQNVQTRPHALEYRAGTAEGRLFYEDMRHVLRTALPFYQKWGQAPEDYEAMSQQALSEMQQPDFVAIWTILTAWGTKPLKHTKTAPTREES